VAWFCNTNYPKLWSQTQCQAFASCESFVWVDDYLQQQT